MYYTYKIIFPGTPYFYWGYHKHSKKEYWGSPKARKWVWDFYDAEKQILEWFQTREEAVSVEQRLIKPYLNDPNCLNEGCGPGFSLKACSEGGKIGGKRTAEIHKANNKDWEQFSREGVEGRLNHLQQNPEFWSEVGKKAAATRWKDPSQKEINARSCRETGKRNKGSRWINDGKTERKIRSGHSPPEGFEWGRLTKPCRPLN
jgi:hypothetical protein